MSNIFSLINLDEEFYRINNKDLKNLSTFDLKNHYFNFGYFEGRPSSKIAIKENFIKTLNKEADKKSILEISPFNNPLMVGKNVKYAEILPKDKLIERAVELKLEVNKIPNIDYIISSHSLESITEKFNIIFASHVIEHQPDLITHLNEVSSKLIDGGIYALILPNAKYCFDANLPFSKISDVINAFIDKRKLHTLGSIIEHRALTTHNDPLRHWTEKKSILYKPIDVDKVSSAIEEFKNSSNQYIDVHAFQFDPMTFSDILNTLIKLKLINFRSVEVNGPVYASFDFTLMLKK
jgi:SAM-dependent methyltransferase